MAKLIVKKVEALIKAGGDKTKRHTDRAAIMDDTINEALDVA